MWHAASLFPVEAAFLLSQRIEKLRPIAQDLNRRQVPKKTHFKGQIKTPIINLKAILFRTESNYQFASQIISRIS
jgi:hypothetical protein